MKSLSCSKNTQQEFLLFNFNILVAAENPFALTLVLEYVGHIALIEFLSFWKNFQHLQAFSKGIFPF